MRKIAKKQNVENLLYAGKEELLVGEDALASYNNYIVRLFFKHSGLTKDHLKSNQTKVLDFGAGFGTLALKWREFGGGSVDCLEIDPQQRSEISKRGFKGFSSLSEVSHQYDFIYTSNVLEHIEDDRQTLRELRSKLKNDGRIGIYVPAFMVLFSGLDRQVGHYRRYKKAELINKVEDAGFAVIECRYVDSIGFFASLFLRIFGYKGVGNLGGSKSLEFYDTLVFPISQVLDKLGLKYVLGKNLFLVAKVVDKVDQSR